MMTVSLFRYADLPLFGVERRYRSPVSNISSAAAKRW
jgi:hypothetical protein